MGGINWYLHVIHGVTQGGRRERRHIMTKREVENKQEISKNTGNRIFSPREELDIENLGKEEGTNIELVRLNRHASPVENVANIWEITMISLIAALIVSIFILVLVVSRRRTIRETISDGGSSNEVLTYSRRVSSEKETSSVESTPFQRKYPKIMTKYADNDSETEV